MRERSYTRDPEWGGRAESKGPQREKESHWESEAHLLLQVVPHADHRLPVQACVRGHQDLWVGQRLDTILGSSSSTQSPSRAHGSQGCYPDPHQSKESARCPGTCYLQWVCQHNPIRGPHPTHPGSLFPPPLQLAHHVIPSPWVSVPSVPSRCLCSPLSGSLSPPSPSQSLCPST